MNTTIGVMQVCDSLAAGGMERVAVNIANALPAARYRSWICATRDEGPLADLVQPHVGRLFLQRRGRFDRKALRRLANHLRQENIQIVHAHGSSVFFAVAAAWLARRTRVVWHDHFGRYATEERPVWLYRLMTGRTRAVVTVNQPLCEWARRRLKLPAEKVTYIPNFVHEPDRGMPVPALPGKTGRRMVCVANFRPQKDHFGLLRAMRDVLRRVPDAHLLLIGERVDQLYFRSVETELLGDGLAGRVTMLGPRRDVGAVLRGCDVAVLSSASEGLPLALLEYGLAGLPVVATNVGQCAEVLGQGECGLVVPPGAPGELARGLVALLESAEQRAVLGAKFRQRIHQLYSPEAVMQRIEDVYDRALGARRNGH